MHLVGAGLGDYVDVGTRVAAEAGVVGRSLDLEFLNSVRIGDSNARVETEVTRIAVAGGVVDGNAVHLVVVLLGAGAVDAHVLRTAAKCRPVGHLPRDAR